MSSIKVPGGIPWHSIKSFPEPYMTLVILNENQIPLKVLQQKEVYWPFTPWSVLYWTCQPPTYMSFKVTEIPTFFNSLRNFCAAHYLHFVLHILCCTIYTVVFYAIFCCLICLAQFVLDIVFVLPTFCPFCPLGRFGLVVAMSVGLLSPSNSILQEEQGRS